MYEYIIKNNDTNEEKRVYMHNLKLVIYNLGCGNYTIIRCDIATGEILKVFTYNLLEEDI